jgi:hypothetical protein
VGRDIHRLEGFKHRDEARISFRLLRISREMIRFIHSHQVSTAPCRNVVKRAGHDHPGGGSG